VCACSHLAIDLGNDGSQQSLLIAEAVIEGAAGETDLRGEIVHPRGGKTRCRERLSRRPTSLMRFSSIVSALRFVAKATSNVAYDAYIRLTASEIRGFTYAAYVFEPV
jgi:hypothetical protein